MNECWGVLGESGRRFKVIRGQRDACWFTFGAAATMKLTLFDASCAEMEPRMDADDHR
jgi:hypothetical protein